MRQQFTLARSCALVAAIACALGMPTFAGTTPLYAGKGGFLEYRPGSTAGNGVAVGYGDAYTSSGVLRGDRAYRWDASGAAAVELPTLSADSRGFTFAQAFAINASNVVAGAATKYSGDTSLGWRGVRWSAAGSVTELGNLGTDRSGVTNNYAWAINDSGTAAGYGDKYVNNVGMGWRAIRWNAGGAAATELKALGTDASGVSESQAKAINAGGTVVGYSRVFGPGLGGGRAVRWAAGSTTPTELGNLGTSAGGAVNNIAEAVNDSGTATGFAYKFLADHTSVGMRAVRWNGTGTAATELATLGTDSKGLGDAEGQAINNAGLIVGYSRKYTSAGADLGYRAVRWNPGGTAATELGNLGPDSSGYSDCQAVAVNSSGIAVGYARDLSHGPEYHAAYWGADGVAVDLNKLAPAGTGTLYQALGISDSGWVTISGEGGPFLMLIPSAGTYGSGDANFDASVNFSDLVVVAEHYNKTNASRAASVGDFDLNGSTNFGDLVTLAQHYNMSAGNVASIGGADFAADWALAQSLVPEPTAVALLGLLGVTRRRRR